MEYSEYLSHHGILGQKWGKRNGPPYPLGSGDHSVSEKKAGWQKSLSANQKNTNRKKEKTGGLSPSTKKKIAIAAGLLGSALAVYGLTRMVDVNQVIRNSMDAGRLTFKKTAATGASKAASKTSGVFEERVKSGIKKWGLMRKSGVDPNAIKMRKLWTFRSMDDDGMRIAPGSVLQRVISDPTNPESIKNAEYAFVAATDADKKNYAGFFASLKKFRSQAAKMYKADMTTISEIVSPSKKQRVQTFIDMYMEDPDKMSRTLAAFEKRQYGEQYRESVEELTKKFRNMSIRQLRNKGYYSFANSWFDQEAGTLSGFMSRLKKQGFNATIDDNDMRSFIQAEKPLIIFDLPGTIGNIRVSELTDDMIKQNMLDWQNMAHQYLMIEDTLEVTAHE